MRDVLRHYTLHSQNSIPINPFLYRSDGWYRQLEVL